MTRTTFARSALCAATLAAAAAAHADTTTYSFAGRYFANGGSQDYTGSFSIVDPTPTAPRPWKAPDVTNPAYVGIWEGTSEFFTGGSNLVVTFASGTTLQASTMDIVVNNTTFQGTGSPYPEGLSVQLYPVALTITAPTQNVCATPTGVCGEDDDPLYHDATQAGIMGITDLYFAFYNAPLAGSPGMPDLMQFGGGGLGVVAGPTTTLTSFSMLTSEVTVSPLPAIPAVPEPGTWAMMLAGLAAIGARAQRSRKLH